MSDLNYPGFLQNKIIPHLCHMRYERKYRIEAATAQEVENILQQIPLSFQTAYPDRRVNSIYLDDFAFQALNDNLGGIAERYKYRIRWYGKNLEKIKKPVLEKKIKKNQLGAKEFKKLPDFRWDADFDFTAFLQANTDLSFDMRPVTVISYWRSYFVSFDGLVRATIDRDLKFYKCQNGYGISKNGVNDKAIILEIKYDESLDNKLDEVFQAIPFRLGKNSKYVSGVLENNY